MLPTWLILLVLGIILGVIVIPRFLPLGSRWNPAPSPGPRTALSPELRARGALSLLEPYRPARPTGLAAMTFSKGGQTVAGLTGGALRFWDGATGALVDPGGSSFLGIGGHVYADLIYSVSVNRLAAVALAAASTYINVWNAADGGRVAAREYPGLRLSKIAFVPDGNRIAWLTTGTVGTWNPDTDAAAQVPDEDASLIAGVREEDGRPAVATAGGLTITLRDPATLETRAVHDLATDAHALGFVAEGAFLVCASFSTIEVWETATGRLVGRLQGRIEDPRSVCAPPGLDRVAVGDAAGRIYLWRPATGEILAEVQAHEGAVHYLACSSTDRLASSGFRDTVVWDVARMRSASSPSAP